MDWLSDRILTAQFECQRCKGLSYETYRCGDGRPQRAQDSCPDCSAAPDELVYLGTLPDKSYALSRETYEQNGRKGIRIKLANGKVVHRAASKDHYLRTGEVPTDTPRPRTVYEKEM